jgi:SAM-dependent methyltransferase
MRNEPSAGAAQDPLRDIVASCGRGETPPAIALMRLAMLTQNQAAFAATIEASRQLLDTTDAETAWRLASLQALAESAPDAWTLVRAVLAAVPHDRQDGTLEARLADLSAAFDRAAALSPEASVALYSLGRPELLDAATAEVADYLDKLGLLGPDRTLIDIGCGVGRFERALANKVGRIAGLDISPAMVELARRNCAGLANVDIRLSSGKDLAAIAAASADAVLAIDAFPYIVSASPGLAEIFVREIARTLKPRGDFLLVNYSYRSDVAADRAEIARLALSTGFRVLRSDERPFGCWDGRVFHLRKKT